MSRRSAILAGAGLLSLAAAMASATEPADAPRPVGAADDWAYYAADNAATKYSRLDDVNLRTVKDLELAWRWRSVDDAIAARRRPNENGYVAYPSVFRATPLVIDGRMYVRTSFSLVVALDAATGKELWTYDPKTYLAGRPGNYGHVGRGLAWWTDETGAPRIISIASDGKLVALDPGTGRPLQEFGEGGTVDVGALMRFSHTDDPVQPANYGFTSVPLVCNGTILVGHINSRGPDTQSPNAPYGVYHYARGDVFGFDAKTGAHLWTFHTIPLDGEFGRDTWKTDNPEFLGKANVWSMMSCDDETGLAYLPVAAAHGITVGVHRPGDNLFSQSLVALDARTGTRAWHYQLIHHGIWDYDPPAAPVLMDITVDGRTVEAVAIVTKQAFTYVFDRHTGEPVWPIEERPVPQSVLPGEETSPTQPFPTRPPPFDEQAPVTPERTIDFTPQMRADAEAYFARYGRGALFTPPGPGGTLFLPGIGGGGNWGGGAFDPETQRFFVPSQTYAFVIGFEAVPEGSAAYRALPFGLKRTSHRLPNDLPLTKPPYGRVTALDMSAGEIAWTAVNGAGWNQHPLLAPLDLPPLGSAGTAGPLATPELVFTADRGAWREATRLEDLTATFRAYDKRTGEIVWEFPLNTTYGGAPPMTYRAGGRQYIVLSVGGRDGASKEQPGPPNELLAFALPDA